MTMWAEMDRALPQAQGCQRLPENQEMLKESPRVDPSSQPSEGAKPVNSLISSLPLLELRTRTFLFLKPPIGDVCYGPPSKLIQMGAGFQVSENILIALSLCSSQK